MDMRELKEATRYINGLRRVNTIYDEEYTEDVLYLPLECEIKVLEDSNVVIKGLGYMKDGKAKDLLRVVRVKDALNMKYEETKILVPSIFAHSLEEKPWHITTQGFLTTVFTSKIKEFIIEESKRLSEYYGKHAMDSLWLSCSKNLDEMKEGDVVCIFNRRVSGWDGSIDRPVIELLGAGGHLQSIWDVNGKKFVTRTLTNNIAKEFDEEIGLKVTDDDVHSIGGFINTSTYELVILSNIFINPEMIPQIQEYALGNWGEDTDGIYLGSFKETMEFYKKDATYFAGGNIAAKTNFPYNDRIMERFYEKLEV